MLYLSENGGTKLLNYYYNLQIKLFNVLLNQK
jgi:hypothetical protein